MRLLIAFTVSSPFSRTEQATGPFTRFASSYLCRNRIIRACECDSFSSRLSLIVHCDNYLFNPETRRANSRRGSVLSHARSRRRSIIVSPRGDVCAVSCEFVRQRVARAVFALCQKPRALASPFLNGGMNSLNCHSRKSARSHRAKGGRNLLSFNLSCCAFVASRSRSFVLGTREPCSAGESDSTVSNGFVRARKRAGRGRTRIYN
jgi:hypothetical protein